MSYELLTPDNLAEYLKSQPHLHGAVDPDRLAVREVGDGNLNLVFICESPGMPGLCIKQALPYVRMVGPEWPLSPERACAEARSYEVASEAVPELVPRFYGFDPDRYALAIENLSSWTVLRSLLNRGVPAPGAEIGAGTYAARMVFATSFMGLPSEKLRRQVCTSANTDLCGITEQLVLTEPFADHPRNSFPVALKPDVEQLHGDAGYTGYVQSLKHQFLTRSEALVHGDLHTGSVMVRPADSGSGGGPAAEMDEGGPTARTAGAAPAKGEHPWTAKVFDPEFCFYGPAGVDVGMFVGNLALAAGRAAVGDPAPELVRWLVDAMTTTWTSFEAELRRLWPTRVDASFGDDFLEDWLLQTSYDVCGYAGCEIVRRIVGLAKVSDLETLEEESRVAAQAALLSAARKATPRRLLGGRASVAPATVVSTLAGIVGSELGDVG